MSTEESKTTNNKPTTPTTRKNTLNISKVDDHEPANQQLKHSWSLWYDDKELTDNNKRYVEFWKNVKSIGTVTTAEEFWSLTIQLKTPVEIDPRLNWSYYFFKTGIKPQWDDEAGYNKNGGKWIITIRVRNAVDCVARLWEEILCALIGQQLEPTENYADEICGICLQAKPQGYKLSIWTKNAENEGIVMAIGNNLMKLYGFMYREYFPHLIPTSVAVMHYESHAKKKLHKMKDPETSYEDSKEIYKKYTGR